MMLIYGWAATCGPVKALQDDERKGGRFGEEEGRRHRERKLKEMRRERDRNERKLARGGGGKKLRMAGEERRAEEEVREKCGRGHARFSEIALDAAGRRLRRVS